MRLSWSSSNPPMALGRLACRQSVGSGAVQWMKDRLREVSCLWSELVREVASLCAAVAALGLTLPAGATVAPPTPEALIIMKQREGLENRARSAFGDIGLIERLRDWRKT